MLAHQHSPHHIDLSLTPADCHFEQSMLAHSTLYAKLKIMLFDAMFSRKVYFNVVTLQASQWQQRHLTEHTNTFEQYPTKSAFRTTQGPLTQLQAPIRQA